MKKSPLYDARDLFLQTADGNETAFRRLFDLYKSKIYFFILHIINQEAEAEELVQDVFLRLWTSRHTLNSVANPDAYLFVMAKNRSLDFLQKAAGEQKMKEEWSRKNDQNENTTEEEIDLHESKRLINSAVSELPQQQALVFRLSREQGLSRQEIAHRLNISENTVKNHLAEAIRFIKNYLQHHGDLAFLLFIWHYC